LKNTGEILKFKDGWDLAESYPESFRQRMAQNAEAVPKRRKKKSKQMAKFEKSVEAATAAPKSAKKKAAPAEKGHLAEVSAAVLRRA
jgi:hypothetical protein